MSTDPGPRGAMRARSGDEPDGEWDALFCAVMIRLRQALRVSEDLRDLHDLRDRVADCVAALDQLHERLGTERNRAQRVGRELAQAHAALRRLRLNLASVPGEIQLAPQPAVPIVRVNHQKIGQQGGHALFDGRSDT